METALYNLWPEVGVINQARSNYRFSVLPEQTDYLGCTMKIDKKLRRAEPPDAAKGVVARAYLLPGIKHLLQPHGKNNGHCK